MGWSAYAPSIHPSELNHRTRWHVNYVVTDKGCWEFQGRQYPSGYGAARHKGKKTYVHRLAYRLWVGSIPEGWTVDHLCANRLCMNPCHLEAVTHSENARRMQARRSADRQRMCARGLHVLAESRYRTAGSKGRCRFCANEYQNNRRKKAAA